MILTTRYPRPGPLPACASGVLLVFVCIVQFYRLGISPKLFFMLEHAHCKYTCAVSCCWNVLIIVQYCLFVETRLYFEFPPSL